MDRTCLEYAIYHLFDVDQARPYLVHCAGSERVDMFVLAASGHVAVRPRPDLMRQGVVIGDVASSQQRPAIHDLRPALHQPGRSAAAGEPASSHQVRCCADRLLILHCARLDCFIVIEVDVASHEEGVSWR